MSKLIDMAESSQEHLEHLLAISGRLELILDRLSPECDATEEERNPIPNGLLNQLHHSQVGSANTANRIEEQLARLETHLFRD